MPGKSRVRTTKFSQRLTPHRVAPACSRGPQAKTPARTVLPKGHFIATDVGK